MLIIWEVMTGLFMTYLAFITFKVKQNGYNSNNDARIKLIESDVHQMKGNIHDIKSAQTVMTTETKVNSLRVSNSMQRIYTANIIIAEKMGVDISKYDLNPED